MGREGSGCPRGKAVGVSGKPPGTSVSAGVGRSIADWQRGRDYAVLEFGDQVSTSYVPASQEPVAMKNHGVMRCQRYKLK